MTPALGGLIAGILIYTFAPEAEGHGTGAMIDSFHRGRGIIRPRVPLVKTSIIMVCEMTRGYGLLVPLMFISLLTFLLNYRWNLYEKQVSSRINSPAHRGELNPLRSLLSWTLRLLTAN